MKKFKYIFLLLLFTSVSSCEKFLEEDPFSSVDPGSLFTNEQGALAAVNATYKLMSSNQDYYGREFLYITEATTEAITTRRDASDERGQMDNWLWDPNHSFLALTWVSAYRVINAANGVIENVPVIDMDESLANRIVGEAKFLRAINYFNLVRLWGDVPIRTEQIKGATESLELERRSAAEVYDLIISDLEEAINVLPTRSGYDAYDGANTGRVTQGAAQTLLAKVYLQRGSNPEVSMAGDFQKCLDYCNAVIASNEYILVDEYRSIFDVNSENGPEVIFDIQHTAIAGLGGDVSGHVVPRRSGIGRTSFGNLHAEVPWYKTLNQNGDQRIDSFILQYVLDGDTITYDPDDFENDNYVHDGPGLFKLAEFDATIPEDAAESPNKVLLRYADVLLMKAEAINEINSGPNGEAYDVINEVRERAGIGELTAGLDYQQFKDAVFTERRKELVFEYHGWFDGLRNWDTFIDRVLANVQTRNENIDAGIWPGGTNAAPRFFTNQDIRSDKFKLFPVPQSIMDTNSKLDQNPDW
ncbi:RagB/SusD family nutrient uptake outer membrane protein [Marinigracilibium pacificum]|uniref:RagB/SusD family nutrient uptake outer membrane protein n=1 Tax=Marinigracilibium pacificum TaxID=2729599 RepID=A0A848J026_9BACT|nr:RagB/SusD family nutrient uptake outer membrane protein [Marinigracilibium pacificum]NMM48738.1 RagB/SusD family nutrient uptake outer membrane protein [Marinigracilibium pacificum]